MPRDDTQEIGRILALLQSGKLTAAQATELISALRDAPRESAAPHSAEAAADDDLGAEDAGSRDDTASDPDFDDAADATDDDRDSRRRHRKHRHRQHGWGGFHYRHGRNDIGEDIERAVEIGTRTLRSVFKSGFGMGSNWGGSANDTVLSRAEPPSGVDFVCENNHFAVSHLTGLRLSRSTFSGNHVNAAGVEDIDLVDSTFTGQHLNGAYLKSVLVEHGHVRDNELSGGRLTRLTVGEGRVENCSMNGSKLQDIGVSKSVMENCRINGTNLKALVINSDSHVKGLSLDGVLGRNWLIESGVVSDTVFSGVRVDGLVLKRSGLEGVEFRQRERTRRREQRGLGLIRDLTLQRVVLKRCKFEDCRFDGTRFEGFDASDLEFDGIDFRGLTITSGDELARLAGGRRVA